jgi:hypothetical protein
MICTCVATAHDLRTIALAALICTLASLMAINLLRRAHGTTASLRHLWPAKSAISTGFGISATHFVGMLAFEPEMVSSYNIVLMVLSWVLRSCSPARACRMNPAVFRPTVFRQLDRRTADRGDARHRHGGIRPLSTIVWTRR